MEDSKPETGVGSSLFTWTASAGCDCSYYIRRWISDGDTGRPGGTRKVGEKWLPPCTMGRQQTDGRSTMYDEVGEEGSVIGVR